jgi:hypothetical protein
VKTNPTFAIQLTRLPKVDALPGLVLLSIDGSNGEKPARKVGALTDVALRGRLAHWNLHPANEVAALRKALSLDEGQVTVLEGWSGLASCLHFWSDFTGSQIRPVEWQCDQCAEVQKENVGAGVGETISLRCKCGTTKRITTQAYLPRLR